MYPHERSLVERLRGQPFALLGVNCDQSRQAARNEVSSAGLNWRSWWDGQGRIQSQWQVSFLPTIYVIDAHGVIRYTPVDFMSDRAGLERVIDKLLKEA